jgi:hypothetical protein
MRPATSGFGPADGVRRHRDMDCSDGSTTPTQRDAHQAECPRYSAQRTTNAKEMP